MWKIVSNPFYVTGLFLYLLNTSENPWFPNVFRGFRKKPVAWNELNKWKISLTSDLKAVVCLSRITWPICDTLRDLYHFYHYHMYHFYNLKKNEKDPWRSVTFSKVAGWLKVKFFGLLSLPCRAYSMIYTYSFKKFYCAKGDWISNKKIQIINWNVPDKHLSWWRHIEDVLKVSSE